MSDIASTVSNTSSYLNPINNILEDIGTNILKKFHYNSIVGFTGLLLVLLFIDWSIKNNNNLTITSKKILLSFGISISFVYMCFLVAARPPNLSTFVEKYGRNKLPFVIWPFVYILIVITMTNIVYNIPSLVKSYNLTETKAPLTTNMNDDYSSMLSSTTNNTNNTTTGQTTNDYSSMLSSTTNNTITSNSTSLLNNNNNNNNNNNMSPSSTLDGDSLLTDTNNTSSLSSSTLETNGSTLDGPDNSDQQVVAVASNSEMFSGLQSFFTKLK